MEFITTGNRIAVENFSIGKVYTIVWATGNYKSLACVGKGSDFVMFQDQEPDLLFCLTMDSAITVSSIEEGGGGSGTMNYNELENKPSINGIVLVGNKTGADLNLVSQADLDDYATNASVVAGLATKQDALSSSQLAAVNSGITSALVTQIGTNTSAIAGKQDALSSSQLAAVNSGITSSDVAQITTNKNNILTVANTDHKNMLKFANVYPGQLAGATYTVNSDNSVTVNTNGTLPADSYVILFINTTDKAYIDKYCNGRYKLTGCPTGGANDKYIMYAASGSYTKIDTGSGVVLDDTTQTNIQVVISIAAGQSHSNLTFKPMISLIGSDDTYEPYVPTNAELYDMIKALQ